ncbi:MAG: PBP1A family penicillin-binding protein [Candidatus Electryonea clarkiae]|nr:PBP1A family penicillin-binding protein [Candidatus Electryonea clarkiae]MDP8286853.1 PBP1A family penicillin-binding protein [Candidatus Electryonea clarkiae]
MNRLPPSRLRAIKPAKKIAQKKSPLRQWPPTLKTMAFAGLATGIIGIGVLALLIKTLSSDLPGLEQLETYNPRLITKVLGADSTVLKEFYTERRVQVPLDSVAKCMVDAVLATEDRKFYSHWGVDPVGIIRASLVNISTLSTRQGASTITQQLARNLYLHRKQTLKRKIREAITAVLIERTYSKEEILEMYFTQMYFGHGAYGIQAAARKYFNIDAYNLTVPQAAMLTALLKAPSHYSPFLHAAKAQKRRNVVLASMWQNGSLSTKDFLEYKKSPLGIEQQPEIDNLGIAPYFTEWIRQKLEKLEDELGFDYYRDGLIVHTSLDPDIQALAEASIDSHLIGFQEQFYNNFRKYGFSQWLARTYRDSLIADSILVPEDSTVSQRRIAALEDSIKTLAKNALSDSAFADSLLINSFKVQVAFVAMDPHNGDILAMVGGRDFNESKFNRAVQALRQPGSVFKPIVYTTCIDNGIYANHQILNMVQPVKMSDGTWWRPENYSIDERGTYVSLRKALRHSMNNVSVRLVAGDDKLIPVKEVIRYAHRMGIRTDLAAVPALALGSSAVIPIDIATVYTVFASGGMRADPRSIISIEDRNGTEIISFDSNRESVLSPETVYIMTDLLKDVLNRGTGASARWRFDFHAPGAGKTGTTNNFTDAWFVGFTPNIVACVWVGFDDPQKSLGLHQNGSKVALPIWAIFMRELYKTKKYPWIDFEKPVGVVRVKICEDSGELAGPYCPQLIDEVFRRGDEPSSPCSKHKLSVGGR